MDAARHQRRAEFRREIRIGDRASGHLHDRQSLHRLGERNAIGDRKHGPPPGDADRITGPNHIGEQACASLTEALHKRTVVERRNDQRAL
ncbi:hypothetical protein D3C87_1559470 [compost metagenome]